MSPELMHRPPGEESVVADALGDDFAEFCRRVSPRLVGSVAYHCRDRRTAEEIAQEALTRAWIRWPQVSQMENSEGWVYRVAMNLANSHLRRVRAERRANSRQTLLKDAVVDAAEAGSDIRAAVAALPRRQRTALVLRYYAGFSVADSAEVMGCAEGTVRSLTSQAIQSLREQMAADALGSPHVKGAQHG